MMPSSPVTESLRAELSHAIRRPNDTNGVVTLSKQLDAIVAIFERFAVAQREKEPRAYWVEHPKFGMELSLDPPNEDAVQRGWVATPLFALSVSSTDREGK
jgi:hypothetical protein